MYMKKQKIIIIFVILVSTASLVSYQLFRHKSTGVTSVKVIGDDGSFVNTKPPTEKEKKSGDEIKQSIVDQENKRNNNVPNQSGKTSVLPKITYAEQYDKQVEVGSYINGIFEDGGTCTLTLSNASKKLTANVSGVRGSNNVNCPVLSIPTSSLYSGTWSATVTYVSSTSEGVSTTRNITVDVR